jgi:hypothetical protein
VAKHRFDIAGEIPPILGDGLLLHTGQHVKMPVNEAGNGVAVAGRGRFPDAQSLSRAESVAHILEPSASVWSLKLLLVCLPWWT